MLIGAIRSLRSEGRSLLTSPEWRTLCDFTRRPAARAQGNFTSDAVTLLCKLGQLLYARMPAEEFERLLLDNDVRVFPKGNGLSARCYALDRVSDPGGMIYHSPSRPGVTIGGRRFTVGFTRQAVERLYDRIVPSWRTYEGHADAFEFVYGCASFVPCELRSGGAAVTFFADARRGFWAREYVRAMIGQKAADSWRDYAFRVGYCPIAFRGEFAVANDLLLPGHESTPENALLRRPSAADGWLGRSASNLSTAYLMNTGDFTALKFFHDGGVPQVVPVARPLVDPAAVWGLPRR